MGRYIDANELEKDFPQDVTKHNVIINGNEYPVFLVDHVLHKIRNCPTADVVEVKHGEWKEHFAFDCWHYDCPFCDDGYATKEKDETPPNYCGNCGANLHLFRKDAG